MRVSAAAPLVLLAVLTMAAPAAYAGTPPAPKRVVALYWYGHGFSTNAEFDRGLREVFDRAPAGTIEYDAEYLESNTFPGPEQSLALRDYLRRKYAGHRADVVVALSQVALDFLTHHRDVLFPDAPIVFHTLTRPPPPADARIAARMTGVVVDNVLAKTLDVALRLHPATRNVFVIAQTSEWNRMYDEMLRDEVRGPDPRVPLTYWTDLQLDALIDHVKHVPRESLILYLRYSQEQPGRTIEPLDALSVIAGAATVPVYAMAGSWLGRGSVGGYAIDVRDIGRQAGEIAMKVAAGTPPSDIPVVEAPTKARFDWRQLQRFGVRESQLPPESLVLFRAPTFWQRYGRYAAGAAAVIAAQLVLIVGLLLQRQHTRRAEERLRRSEMEYRNVVETQSELICRFRRDTTLTFVNDAYCRFFGLPREALIGRPFLDFVPPEGRQAVADEIELLVAQPGTRAHEHAVLLSDGTHGWQHWINHAVTSVAGDVVEVQGVGRDVTERRRAENTLKVLAGRLIASQEAERQRIARDLHDDLSQKVALLNIDLDQLGDDALVRQTALSGRVRDLSRRTGDIASELHRVSRDLHPSKLQALGLVAAIRAECRDTTRQHGVAVEFVSDREWLATDADLSLCLYRISQEALHNIVKHSGARRALIHLNLEDGVLCLDILDNGAGFDAAAGSEGLGLVSMRERAHFAGGRFIVESDRSGTRVMVRVPLAAAALRRAEMTEPARC